MDEPLVIFDLDETLIYASEYPMESFGYWRWEEYWIYPRPYLTEMLHEISQYYKIAIWTSSGSDYAKAVVGKYIEPHISLEFVWSQLRCTIRYDRELQEHYALKNLKKVFRKGYDKRRVLMVDDTPQKVRLQYGNYIRVSPFMGNSGDLELKGLSQYLLDLKDEVDFRILEKRGWISRYSSLVSRDVS
ncbi:MAG: HAD family hydrolase [Cyanobacteriota bacterium]|nr:HAD family hydrolase [Cyanobacteriota bacterium]